MSHLTPLAPSSTSKLGPALAHDIRNAMAVIALDVEMLAGPLCNDLLRERAIELTAPRRTSFDIVETIRQVMGILRPITPVGLKIELHPVILRGMCGGVGVGRFWSSTPPLRRPAFGRYPAAGYEARRKHVARYG